MLRRLPSLSVYAIATGSIAVAILVACLFRRELEPAWPGQISSPLLLMSVVFSAWYGGHGPGVYAGMLSLASLEYFFLPPFLEFDLTWNGVPRLATFLAAPLVVARLAMQRRDAESALHYTHGKLRAAREIQQRLYPSRSPALPGLEVAGASFPANTVGGDYFDYVPLLGGRTGIVVADVSGHGLGPAILMAEVRACLRTLALTYDGIADILTLANRLLVQDTEEQFLTIFLAAIDPGERTLVYAGAGHEAFLFDTDGHARKLPSTSFPLGLEMSLVVPRSEVIPLEPGQILLIATDGVSETHAEDGNLFGMERVLDLVRADREKSAQAIVDRLYREARRFAGPQPQHDDITIVVVKIDAASK